MLLSIYRHIRRSGRNSLDIKVRFFANKTSSNTKRIRTSRRMYRGRGRGRGERSNASHIG
jgi:hypothetical protein